MKKLLLLLFSTFFLLPNIFSQEVKPTATPLPDDEVVKISTTLIQIDVTVTDHKGKIVKDLKPEDFEIYENGKKQNITNFSFVSNVKTETETTKETKDNIGIPVPTTELKAEKVRRTFALVVDDLSLSFESAYHVRRALKKFVDEQMQDGDLVAIIRTGAGIGALQQFTTDKRQLHAAIEKVKWNPLGRGGIGAFAPINDSETALQRQGEDEEDTEIRENFENSFSDFQGSVFATGTLGALRYIVTGMSELPGRKSVILFSDGFKIFERDEHGFSGGGRVLEFLKQLVETANRASVVFYTMDMRGLQTTGITAADSVSADPQRLQQILSGRSQELFDTQGGLVFLAQQTGGLSIYNQNDFSGGVSKILDDQSYYLVGYQPDAETFDPQTRRFNKLEVKVKHKNVKVRYRSGFFGISDEKIAKKPANLTPVQQISNALTSPFAVNDISLKLNTLFGNEKNLGSFVRSLLHINAKDLKFADDPDGTKKAVFDVLAVSFGDNGVPVDRISKTYTINVKGETYQKLLDEGFVYHFTFPVKKPGAYQLRVAIRDSQAQKVGSASQFIEVPNLKKNHLTLSGIVLENFTSDQWQRFSNAPQNIELNNAETRNVTVQTNPLSDTSLRKFRKDTILRYGFEVYNAKLDASKKPDLTTQIRIFHEGKQVLDGKQMPLEPLGQTELERIKSVGAISLGTGMPVGDYILQIIIFDNQAKGKRKIATQFVQFEMVE